VLEWFSAAECLTASECLRPFLSGFLVVHPFALAVFACCPSHCVCCFLPCQILPLYPLYTGSKCLYQPEKLMQQLAIWNTMLDYLPLLEKLKREALGLILVVYCY